MDTINYFVTTSRCEGPRVITADYGRQVVAKEYGSFVPVHKEHSIIYSRSICETTATYKQLLIKEEHRLSKYVLVPKA